MKLNRSYLFVATSSIVLLMILIIQVSWIFETAKVREELFNEKAKLVLSKTAEALSSDTATYKHMEISVGRREVRKIDSLIHHYMKFYNIQLGYYFDLKPELLVPQTSFSLLNNKLHLEQAGCYQQCLKETGSTASNGLVLKLVFPGKEQFILDEMGTLFITSVILILIELVMSWRTILSLMKEKKISEHTTEFLNNMTHEFKTPLTNIALAGKMLLKDTNIRQEDKIKHYSGIILEENEKLRLQVEQVLSMTALERDEISLRKTELDLHQIIQECLKCMSVQIENRQGSLRLELNAQKHILSGDKTHLTNALCNLLDNAVKYSPEYPELSIQTYNSNRQLIIVIADKGMGIEEEYQEKVFDKFFRVPTGDVHDVKGFGLGLAYVKKIVDLHEGTIKLTSEKGKGTIFTLALPHV